MAETLLLIFGGGALFDNQIWLSLIRTPLHVQRQTTDTLTFKQQKSPQLHADLQHWGIESQFKQGNHIINYGQDFERYYNQEALVWFMPQSFISFANANHRSLWNEM
ncbi:hypothetical protein [Mucilaginibacter ginsenosidivorax]|uniref:Uncharacterized protein n=1 Tax=Mucilaginibacter ginsenosidivorax TaxID=862126 RepID=A0A5B8W3H3_9SPHI|nr:hypothetical protein [Mucilaginibacter ginsenosidivorax]QEC78273.1 hypothetical protein FSB76_20870 [Mucilaginibacter ginsenosidivorax]